jgi:hypothetical protein
MDRQEGHLSPDDFPFDLGDVLGELAAAGLECPGVYYASFRPHTETEPFTYEYYIVEGAAQAISKEAKTYGKEIPGHPGLLLYSMDEPANGHRIIEYEIGRYKVKHGIPLAATETLHSIALFNMEYHPEYFGAYPVPFDTPWGHTTRHRAVDNGVYWIETDQGEQVLAICYPIWVVELSDAAKNLARQLDSDLERGIESTLGYLFFSEKDCCVPIFELLWARPSWKQSEKIDVPALMNAIWSNHPDYAAAFNMQEQSGLNDTFGLLMNTLGVKTELRRFAENMIALHPEAGTDFLRL